MDETRTERSIGRAERPGRGMNGRLSVETRSLLAWLVLTALSLALPARHASAADNDSFTLDLTIANVLAVNVEDGLGNDLTDYDFGALFLGDITVNQNTIRIDNESGSGSGGLLQTYDLSIADNGSDTITLRTL